MDCSVAWPAKMGSRDESAQAVGETPRDPQRRETRRAEDPSSRVAPREALDVARYVTDMAAQLEAMAIAARLDLLAYFLGMAKAEGDLVPSIERPGRQIAERARRARSRRNTNPDNDHSPG